MRMENPWAWRKLPAMRIIASTLLAALAVVPVAWAQAGGAAPAQNPNEWITKTGPVPPPGLFEGYTLDKRDVQVLIPDVPCYQWYRGCTPTAAGMVIGYWDGHGYDNLVDGDATYMTLQVRAMISGDGNWYDYCLPLDDENHILPDKSEPPFGDEHASNCLADFMKTSRSYENCYYGATKGGLADNGLRDYVKYKVPGLNVLSARIQSEHLTWEFLCSEIDSGYPLVFHVDPEGVGATTHSICVFGYATQGTTQLYGCYNTWTTSVKWYEFAPVAPGQKWGVGEATIFRIGEVDKTVPGDYATIQAALDGCFDGNVIHVAPGTYYENLDYLGKSLTLVSDRGAAYTEIRGDGTGPVVTFDSWEDSDAVLDGFTLTNGHAASGGGVYCGNYSGPTLMNNRILDNQADQKGGGIYCVFASPLLENDIFAGNTAGQSGGGLACDSISSPRLINCTFYGNSAVTSGGAVYSSYFLAQVTAFDSILWNNTAPTGSQIQIDLGAAEVTYCDVQGGYAGTGNIDQDPVFADAAQYDFHLPFISPCKDAGDSTSYELPALDMEGDPRVAYANPDMGADECYRHFYVTGNCVPGGAIQAKFVGEPGTAQVGLLLGIGILDPPVKTHYGLFYLPAPFIGPIGLFPIPANGIEVLPATIPANPPGPYTIPMQALIGTKLSNLCLLMVQ